MTATATIMLRRLSSAFRIDPESNNYKVMEISAGELDQISEVIDDIISSHSIDTATGRSLDLLGDLMGLERGGLSDDDFRTLISSTQAFRFSSGTVADIKNVVIFQTGVSEEDIQIVENPDDEAATFALILLVPNISGFSVSELASQINSARAVGVKFFEDQIQITLNTVVTVHRATLPGYGGQGYGTGGYGHSLFKMTRLATSEHQYGLSIYGESTYGDPCETHSTSPGTLIPLIPGFGVGGYGTGGYGN